ELSLMRELLGLNEVEAEVVSSLPVGMALWRVNRRNFLVRHELTSDEEWVVDTDQKLTANTGGLIHAEGGGWWVMSESASLRWASTRASSWSSTPAPSPSGITSGSMTRSAASQRKILEGSSNTHRAGRAWLWLSHPASVTVRMRSRPRCA